MDGESIQAHQYELSNVGPYCSIYTKIGRISQSVPKFASFRHCVPPSPINKATNIAGKHVAPESSAAENDDIWNHKFQRRRRSNGVRHSHRSSHHSNNLSPIENSQHMQALSQTLDGKENDEREPRNPFVIDRIGDSKNLIYGSLPPLLVPTYFRFGGGEVLGFSTQNKIDRANSSNKSTVLQRGHSDPLGKRNIFISRKTKRHGLETLHSRPYRNHSQKIDLSADFISFKDSRKNEEHSSDDGLSASDKSVHRPTNGRFKPIKQPLDQDLAYKSDAPVSDNERGRNCTTSDHMLQQRMALSQKVKKDPGNCDAWLDLINNQDKAVGLGLAFTEPRITAAERQSTVDMKISLYEKAIHAAKCLKDKERLLLGMMEEGSGIWDNNKLTSKWCSLLKQYPTSMSLWTKYLDFKQSNFLSFGYTEVHAAYLDCLRLLRQIRFNTKFSTTEPSPTYLMQIYVTLRMTVFMREAGYSEHATACWQAVIEYNFFKPIQYQSAEHQIGGPSESTALSAFEKFWESEVARFGEDRAEGWAVFMSKNGKPVNSNPDAKESMGCDPNFKSWVRLERQRSLRSRTPARTIDNIDENDPYNVTLFSDIQPVLLDSPDFPGKLMLVQALFIFCHLPPCPMGLASNHMRTWCRDPFLRNEIIHHLHDPLELCSKSNLLRSEAVEKYHIPTGPSLHAQYKNDFLLFPMPCFQLSSSSLFAVKGSWFSAFDSWENRFEENQGPVELEFIRQLIKSLVHLGIGGDDLAEYYIAFELRLSPTAAIKIAKNLIKHRPSSLRLYGSYAVVEYRLGNARTADHVMITTINMSKTLSDEAQRDSILVWCAWVWELLESGETVLALERLLMFSSMTITSSPKAKPSFPSKPSYVEPALSLRTQKGLMATRDHFISLSLHDHAAKTIECLILYAYLSSELSLTEAHAAFTSNLDLLSTRSFLGSPNHEYVHQAFAKLLHYHVTHISRFTPSMIRSFLAESIIQFPQNTIFLGLYAWIESRSRIDDRVRSIMRDVVLTKHSNRRSEDEESVISHCFAIYSEINRGLTLGSNMSCIRSTFERAVTSTCGAHCAGLWKLYFSFENSLGDLQMAKSVFYRGVRACPWAKELYLPAFQCLEMVMDGKDFSGLYATMLEKELRILAGPELGDVLRNQRSDI